MSHSPGRVIDALGEIVGYFEYNGTVDVARSKIFVSAEERDEAWRREQPVSCACQGVAVRLVCGGLMWDGRACLDHNFIVQGTSPIYGQEES